MRNGGANPCGICLIEELGLRRRESVKEIRRISTTIPHSSLLIPHYYSVAAMTALIVCMRFSASSNTMLCGPSNTSSVTSMASRPYLSWI